MSFIAASSAVRERSVATIMGQVLFLVGAALGLCALGTYLGRDLSFGTARLLSFAGLGMLIAQSFVRPLRYGPLGIGWLAALAALIGFGLGPVLSYYITANPSAVTSAAALTALTVVGMGAAGFAWSKDVSGCMVTHWFRFGNGRDTTTEDACTLETLTGAFARSDGNLRELLLALVQTDAFMFRQGAAQ